MMCETVYLLDREGYIYIHIYTYIYIYIYIYITYRSGYPEHCRRQYLQVATSRVNPGVDHRGSHVYQGSPEMYIYITIYISRVNPVDAEGERVYHVRDVVTVKQGGVVGGKDRAVKSRNNQRGVSDKPRVNSEP